MSHSMIDTAAAGLVSSTRNSYIYKYYQYINKWRKHKNRELELTRPENSRKIAIVLTNCTEYSLTSNTTKIVHMYT